MALQLNEVFKTRVKSILEGLGNQVHFFIDDVSDAQYATPYQNYLANLDDPVKLSSEAKDKEKQKKKFLTALIQNVKLFPEDIDRLNILGLISIEICEIYSSLQMLINPSIAEENQILEMVKALENTIQNKIHYTNDETVDMAQASVETLKVITECKKTINDISIQEKKRTEEEKAEAQRKAKRRAERAARRRTDAAIQAEIQARLSVSPTDSRSSPASDNKSQSPSPISGTSGSSMFHSIASTSKEETSSGESSANSSRKSSASELSAHPSQKSHSAPVSPRPPSPELQYAIQPTLSFDQLPNDAVAPSQSAPGSKRNSITRGKPALPPASNVTSSSQAESKHEKVSDQEINDYITEILYTPTYLSIWEDQTKGLLGGTKVPCHGKQYTVPKTIAQMINRITYIYETEKTDPANSFLAERSLATTISTLADGAAQQKGFCGLFSIPIMRTTSTHRLYTNLAEMQYGIDKEKFESLKANIHSIFSAHSKIAEKRETNTLLRQRNIL